MGNDLGWDSDIYGSHKKKTEETLGSHPHRPNHHDDPDHFRSHYFLSGGEEPYHQGASPADEDPCFFLPIGHSPYRGVQHRRYWPFDQRNDSDHDHSHVYRSLSRVYRRRGENDQLGDPLPDDLEPDERE